MPGRQGRGKDGTQVSENTLLREDANSMENVGISRERKKAKCKRNLMP